MSFKRINENGAFAPFVGILLVVLFALVGLVVDLGHIYNVKTELQRAVDAAALAGAHRLVGLNNTEIQTNAQDAAWATAETNTVDSRSVDVDTDNIVVVTGWWDDTALGTPPDDRFTEGGGGNPLNAVKVTASTFVDYFFMSAVYALLPGPDTAGTTVTVDAIAINQFEEETIPIALVSCIPTGGGTLNIASPGLSICDITTYEFHSDSEDTAAWTSLTFNPASKSTIENFLTQNGRALFNEVVYGSDGESGLEYSQVDTDTRIVNVPDVPEYESVPRGCLDNDGTTVNCGLGLDISLNPESIDGIRQVDSSKIAASSKVDPLTDYDPGLPRWYHFTDNDTERYNLLEDAFTRVWTQDGHLVPPPLGFGDQDHLQALYDTPDGVTNSPYSRVDDPDFRFKKFIEKSGSDYVPNYNEVLRYAGYPPVWVNNGTIPPALDTFLDRIADDASHTFRSGRDYEPYNLANEGNSGGTGYTVQLTVPVIFAGDCDSWKAVSSGPATTNLTLFYVGTANFLVTRAWHTNSCYEHGTTPITVSDFSPPDGPAGGCSPSDFDPPLASGVSFECTGGPGSNPNAGMEGVIRPPTRGEDAEVGIRKIYLVK